MTTSEALWSVPENPLLNLEIALAEAGAHRETCQPELASASPREGRTAAAPANAPEIAQPEALESRPTQELSAEGRKAFYLMNPTAPEACLQQFRQLRGRLFRLQETLARQRVACRSLFVTSPSPGEGKSFVAMNLALMMAVAPECRILLVDCNVRRPSFPAWFHIPAGEGLRDAMAGACWRSVSRRLPGTNLCVTGLGEQERSAQEPLDYNRLRAWMNRVEDDFDWIVLDGPSLKESADAEMLSYAADRTLLVVRRGETTFEAMDHCLARIDDTMLAGVVLNR